MATYAANPYYDDPFLNQAASNLAKVFIDPNPGRTATQRAQARLYTLQGDKLDRESQKRSSIANAFRALKGGAITPEQFDAITGDAVEADMRPADISGMTLYRQSNSGQPVSAVGRAFVGAGHAIGQNQGLSVEDREAVAARENNEAARRSSISAGPGYAAVAESRRYHDNELAFKEKTRFDKADHVPEGNAVFPSADDPRYKGVSQGSIPAPRKDKDRFGVSPNGDGSFSYRILEDGTAAPVPSSEKDRFVESQDDAGNSVWRKATEGIPGPVPKAAQDRFVQSEDPNNPGKNVYVKAREGVAGPAIKLGAEKFVLSEDPNNPGRNVYVSPREGASGPAIKPPAPMDVSSEEAAKLELGALQSVGAADKDWNVDSKFAEQYAAQMPAAKAEAARVYQQTRDAAAAQAAYLKRLSINAGSKWDGGSSVFGRALRPYTPFVDNPTEPGFKAPGGTPAPAAAAQQPVPAPAARAPGKIYTTPRGPMMWTPDGWVPPPRADDGVR